MLADSHLFLVLGGKGDLMHRKILPALYRLRLKGALPEPFVILGAARRDETDAGYAAWGREALQESGFTIDEQAHQWLERTMHYQSVAGGYQVLADRIRDLEQQYKLAPNRIIYLSLPPGAFPAAIENLGATGLNQSTGWTRLVIEKPFGHDTESARELNTLVHRHFREEQVFRIDHYLGKETVQNLLAFRFANPLFEHLWNRDRVERVEITVAERIGLEGRGQFYDQAGALRDMIQNHLTQVLTLAAMEVPGTFEADAVRNEKVKVLRSVQPIRPEDVVLGQFGPGVVDGQRVGAYKDEPGVAPGSKTETFVAMRLFVNNWRWQGVPFFLRTGKHLPRRISQITVTFRKPPVMLFDQSHLAPNQLTITLQPDEGFDLTFQVKAPGDTYTLQQQRLTFRYADVAGPLPEAYETLIQDVMAGDPTLFVRADWLEASWELYTPVLRMNLPVYSYPAGVWGPWESTRLLGTEDAQWATQ
ncbi:MAG TPA: glucose-6-phosphate dehydrogenase [Symbiobacteriaceae bacterium]|jgi:glucose-6-phosphate 1-dehydrogenase|nr:glucose-6-phosphate dehydrogenase [Symbiobacteriaceae bacterium]